MAGRRRTGAAAEAAYHLPKSWVHPPKSPLQRGIPEGAALRPPESSAVGVCSKLAKRTWVRGPALSCGHALRRTAPWRHAAPPGLNAQEPACLLRKSGGSLALRRARLRPVRQGQKLESPFCLLRKSGGALAKGGAWLRQKRRLTALCKARNCGLRRGLNPVVGVMERKFGTGGAIAFAFMFGFLPRTAV